MSTKALTRAEVKLHSKPGDAWVIIDKVVYDVSKFAELHPGGERLLLEHAGQDVTKLFHGLHRSEVLSKYASNLIIGAVDGAEASLSPAPLISRVPFAENSWGRKGWKSPYYNESHTRFQLAVRTFVRDELQKQADEGEDAGKPPPAEAFLKCGAFGLLACRIGPGPHLHMLGRPLPGDVAPDSFDYFHEMIAHEEMA